MNDGLKPAGWYHALGDPPDTYRYWDGSNWYGEPTAAGELSAVNTVVGAHSQVPDQSRPGVVASGTTPQRVDHDGPVQPHSVDPAVNGDYRDQGNVGSGDLGVFDVQPPPEQGFPVLTGNEPPVASRSKRRGGSAAGVLRDMSFSNRTIIGDSVSATYTLAMVLIGAMTLAAVVRSLSQGLPGLLSVLVIVPAALFAVVLTRLMFESLATQRRQYRLIERMADELDERSSASND